MLARALSGEQSRSGIRSSITIPDVYGSIDPSSWIETLGTNCGVQTTEIDSSTGSIPINLGPAPRLLKVTLAAPSSKSVGADLSSNDAFFASILDILPTQNYTVLYTTTRARDGGFGATQVDQAEYEMESSVQEAMHVDLKRDLSGRAATQVGNQTLIDGPLFDKYQFFTPGKYALCPYSPLSRSLTLRRDFHGLPRRLSPSVYPLCCNFCRCLAAGLVRGLR